MSLFNREIEALRAATARVTGGRAYGIPWYLVIGEPRVGKSTVIRKMNLSFTSEGPLQLGSETCTYWLAKEAVFIECGERISGPNRNPDYIVSLCEALKSARPREPLDAILLVLSATDVAELEGERLEAHAQILRSYLVEACRTIGADIPVYVIVNRYDTLWGFAEVFGWNQDRAKEEAWGFIVPPDTPSQATAPRVDEGIDQLNARIEAMCLTKLSSDEGVEQRIRAFQHLVEARVFTNKLREVMKVVGISSAYERAPWMRALIAGSSVPGVGDRIRAGVQRFVNMGLAQNPYDPHRSARPGGLPLFDFVPTVVIPEKELVPLKIRWRDDLVTIVGLILGILLFSAVFALRFIL